MTRYKEVKPSASESLYGISGGIARTLAPRGTAGRAAPRNQPQLTPQLCLDRQAYSHQSGAFRKRTEEARRADP